MTFQDNRSNLELRAKAERLRTILGKACEYLGTTEVEKRDLSVTIDGMRARKRVFNDMATSIIDINRLTESEWLFYRKGADFIPRVQDQSMAILIRWLHSQILWTKVTWFVQATMRKDEESVCWTFVCSYRCLGLFIFEVILRMEYRYAIMPFGFASRHVRLRGRSTTSHQSCPCWKVCQWDVLFSVDSNHYSVLPTFCWWVHF